MTLEAAPPAITRARVVRVAGATATVLVGDEEREARLPPRIAGGPPVAGDLVAVDTGEDPPRVLEIGPRATLLARGDGSGRAARTLVANADLLVVVASAVLPPLRPRLVDRYLVAAAAGGLDAAVVITKVDLPHDEEEVQRFAALYREIGYPVLTGCAWDADLAGRVVALIDGRIAVLAGHSGVGKSTLTHAVTGVPREVATVSRKAGTGRHTTTDPRLIPLAGGPGRGAVVDTAGVRTFHLPPMDAGALQAGFPEIAAAAERCRFRGCAHGGDAGCAVAAKVSPERLDSYRRLLATLRAHDDRP